MWSARGKGCVMPLSGLDTIKRVREHQSQTLLAFSRGKDAIAAWIALRPHFDRVIPYYLYMVPGLEFEEESLDYYERFFGERIVRLPHTSIYRQLKNLTFQAPQNCIVIEQAQLPAVDYNDIREAMIELFDLQDDALVADGVRAADSPMRRIAIHTHGTISWNLRKYHPIWDMRKADLEAMFRAERVKLPVDYKVWGRTFDGIDLRFLVPLKRHFPRDYQRVLEYFPLADAEVFRWECSKK